MTETSTLDEVLPELIESDHLGADATAPQTPLRSRVLLPVLLPLLSIAVVAVLVLDISRVFLAGDKDAALVMGIALTVAIMLGATLIAAAPRLRSSMLAMILGGVFLVVSGAGLVSLGPSLDDGTAATGYQAPVGAAKATVAVQVVPNKFAFTSKSYTAPAGIVRIDYSGQSGHTLAFTDPKLAGFRLSTSASGPTSGKVDLPPGKYTLYCTITGHAAAGMTATLTVTK
ncbi:MAG TPA: sulfocyanin-like copper-binding protein [Acidimicrobiia bacterium]